MNLTKCRSVIIYQTIKPLFSDGKTAYNNTLHTDRVKKKKVQVK